MNVLRGITQGIEYMGFYGVYWINPDQDTGQVAVSYEYGNGLSGSVTGGNLIG
jgi:hypothetical protein